MKMSARHDDYKVDWRASRPGDPEPVREQDSWPRWLVNFAIGAALVITAMILIARSQRWLP